MAYPNVLAQVQPGMEVHTADGSTLGKVVQVWIGSDPVSSTARCDEDVCSRLEVQHRDGTRYIPYNAIERVSGRWVILNMDTAAVNEHDWFRRPLWIAADDPLGAPGRTYTLRT